MEASAILRLLERWQREGFEFLLVIAGAIGVASLSRSDK
jgi:hypothetical protein